MTPQKRRPQKLLHQLPPNNGRRIKDALLARALVCKSEKNLNFPASPGDQSARSR